MPARHQPRTPALVCGVVVQGGRETHPWCGLVMPQGRKYAHTAAAVSTALRCSLGCLLSLQHAQELQACPKIPARTCSRRAASSSRKRALTSCARALAANPAINTATTAANCSVARGPSATAARRPAAARHNMQSDQQVGINRQRGAAGLEQQTHTPFGELSVALYASAHSSAQHRAQPTHLQTPPLLQPVGPLFHTRPQSHARWPAGLPPPAWRGDTRQQQQQQEHRQGAGVGMHHQRVARTRGQQLRVYIIPPRAAERRHACALYLPHAYPPTC